MSQTQSKTKGKARYHDDEPAEDAGSADPGRPASSRPGYMTVGNGSTSEHAAHLQAMLDTDSGYGGSSTAGDDALTSSLFSNAAASAVAWDSAVPENRHLHLAGSDTAASSASGFSSTDRRLQAGAIHQLWYNQQRVALGKAISQAVELLKGLQEMNTVWPAHYPTVQRAGPPAPTFDRPGLQRASTMAGEIMPPRSSSSSAAAAVAPSPGALRRTQTFTEDNAEAESSRAGASRSGGGSGNEPRLVTPQIAQEFSVLKLDLKLGGLHQAELVHSLEKGSVAALLDEKIRSSVKHLLALRERIEDTSSKVLITGDLNAGKSTFCNALLRRKILPEDQQPCTSIFCEVLDAGENGGVEEVHAVHKGAVYLRHDESTYDVFPLHHLEQIVTDNSTYMQCKVYVKDARTIDESLLNNGIVDIALIDAPGLNSDTTKTTAVFARQEEIDVVVFVVSATNHFTLTATEFIRAAAAEKAYLFVVVNGFDVIRDRQRCQKMILDQVAGLSPQTRKEASELVHFVSSNAIPIPAGGPGGPGGGGGGGGGGDDDGDPSGSDGKGKGKEKVRDFENMEQSLRRFVLEKRARSKLAPAKNYLLNILNDVHALATANAEVAQGEIDRVEDELREIEPQLASNQRARTEVAAEAEQIIEQTCRDVYDSSRAAIGSAIARAGQGAVWDVEAQKDGHGQRRNSSCLGVPYPGLLGVFDYAEAVKQALLSQIAASVVASEQHARVRAAAGVDTIKQLGVLHLGADFADLAFRPEFMFRRRRDELARQIDIPTELWDFVDLSTLLQRQEKLAGTGMALTVATALGSRLIGLQSWTDHAVTAAKLLLQSSHARRLLLPGVALAAVAAVGYVLAQIPQALPQRLATKISVQLGALDYVHHNAARISATVRKVLRFPADAIRDGLNQSVEKLGTRRAETLKVRGESEVALKYFGNLVTDSARHRSVVRAVDLEAPPAGGVH